MPLTKVSHMTIWVLDQDEARDFYVDKLGLEVREDSTLEEMGGFRWLTVGPKDQPDLEMILLVPGPPPVSPEATEQVKQLMAQGVLAGCIFRVEDCQATYEELRDRGVEFTQEPVERFYGIDAAIRDDSGNHLRIIQRPTA